MSDEEMDKLNKRKISKKTIINTVVLIVIPLLSGSLWYFFWGPGSGPNADNYMVPMRDGVRLSTDVYLPEGEGPFPVILYRTPYGKITDVGPLGFRELGVAIVSQDHRGCFDSEGVYTAFGSDGPDAYDTVKWMKTQPWFNGKYGTYGGSARGITQYMQVPFLDDVQCQRIEVATPFLFEQAMYQGGAPRKMLAENWLAGVGGGDYYPTIFDYEFNTSSYALDHQIDTWEWDNVTWPSIHRGGWYDCFSQGIIDGYSGYQHYGGDGGKGHAKLVMGPWTHNLDFNEQGEFIFPDNANSDPNTDEIFEAMFGNKLLGRENLGDYRTMSNVTYYVMGELNTTSDSWNRWAESPNWPIDRNDINYYLHSDGSIATTSQSSLSVQSFLFDPTDPVVTVGGANLVGNNRGPFDQTEVEDSRTDILKFDMGISTPLLVTGRISVKLFIKSNCTDTDFTAKLIDIYPEGTQVLLNDGIARMRYREGLDHHAFMDGSGNTVYEINIDLWSTSHVFNTGHTLRLSISSSNYPRFDVNVNTGDTVEPVDETTAYKIANNSIVISDTYQSALILPIPISTPDFI